MTENCRSCGSEITFGGVLKKENQRLGRNQTKLVNFRRGTTESEFCQSCAATEYLAYKSEIETECEELERKIARKIAAFPMFTCERLPSGVDVRYIGLVTANASVGTGVFNEFSQGFSDFFGVVNTDTGMAHKVNTGEQTVRSILAKKAITIGANCILGVDIDYGTTANNAATVNMQGTAALVDRMEDVLTEGAFAAAAELRANFDRIGLLRGWLAGRFD